MTGATTAVVADTHIVIWYLLNPAKLSREATGALERCVDANETIRVSAHSLVELVYTVERGTNPFTEEDRQASVPRVTDADPGDRIVVATAEVLGLPIVSADPKFPGMTELVVISYERVRVPLTSPLASNGRVPIQKLRTWVPAPANS